MIISISDNSVAETTMRKKLFMDSVAEKKKDDNPASRVFEDLPKKHFLKKCLDVENLRRNECRTHYTSQLLKQ